MNNDTIKFEGNAGAQNKLVGEVKTVLEQDFRQHLQKMDGFLDLLSIQLKGSVDAEQEFTLKVLRNCWFNLNRSTLKLNRIMDEAEGNGFPLAVYSIDG